MKWQDVEDQVRKIAESKWSASCVSEVLHGVQCDGVIRVRPDYFVLIEMSKRSDLAKLRDDMSKLQVVKQALLAEGKFAETYFVTSGDDHPSLRQTAKALSIEFHTVDTFSAKFLGRHAYIHERNKQPFGSAVSPGTGDSDATPYTPINYADRSGARYAIADIAKAVSQGKRVILLGEFGTGKSRCIKETFTYLAQQVSTFMPIAINLRDNWGYKRLDHMVRNHLDALGLSDFSDTLIKSMRRGNHPLLLDGFDEIGSQAWSGDVSLLTAVRRKSLEGVRDAMSAAGTAGMLITGREHYFSSDEEMLECLGLDGTAILLRCPDEFTDKEAEAYITSQGAGVSMPDWMPRKPLICQLLVSLGTDELEAIEAEADSEVAFFEQVVDSVCRRETRISAMLDAATVKSVLLRIAQETRQQHAHSESIAMTMINDAFFQTTGYAAIDESASILQRLPYFGRPGSGSSDRVFIDRYAKSGLRGLAMRQAFIDSSDEVARHSWRQPLDDFGLRVWGAKLSKDPSPLKYVRRCIALGNTQAAADFVGARVMLDTPAFDYQKLTVDGGSIAVLSAVDRQLENLSLLNVHIETLSLDNTVLKNVVLENCVIERVLGVTSREKLPPSVAASCAVESFDDSLSSSKISTLQLSDSQKTLLVMLKKLFFQPGSGRREEALTRGAEGYWDEGAAKRILKYLLSENIVKKIRGDEGDVYVPMRREMSRMGKIVAVQKQSADPLWDLVTAVD